MATRTLRVELIGDDRSLSRALGRSEKRMGKFSQAAKRAGAGLAAGLAGGVVHALKEAQEAEKVGRQTSAVLKSTGGAAKVSRKEIERLAETLSVKSGKDDEAIQAGQNLLLTFKNIRNEAGKGNQIFNEATSAALDMSAGMTAAGKATSIASANMQIGKALNDPIAGLSALTRVGVTFSAQEKEKIKALTESGNRLAAQKIILRELRTEFGGSAAANATATDKMKVAFNNLAESMGKAMLPTVQKAATALGRFFDQLRTGEGLGGRVRNVVNAVVGFGKAHPGLVKAAAGIAGVGLAIKAVRFTGAITGITQVIAVARRLGQSRAGTALADNIVSAARGTPDRVRAAMSSVRGVVSRLLGGAGTAGGERMASAASSTAASNIQASARGGRLKGGFSRAGRLAGGAFGIAAALIIAQEVDKGLGNAFSGKGKPDQTPGQKGLVGNLKDLLGDGPGFSGKAGRNIRARARGVVGNLITSDLGQIPLGKKGAKGTGLNAFNSLATRYGLSIGSGLRPGSRTTTGNLSYHAMGRARDFPGPPAAMLAFARMLARNYGGRLKELIYTPLGFSIKDGRRTAPYAQAQHYDHVHVAMQRGGSVPGRGSGDRVPAMLEPGEGIINRNAVAAMGGAQAIHAINRAIPRFASGGVVARAAKAAGFRGANLIRAVAEAKGESGWNERAVGDGGKSKGLMQIHTGFNPWAARMNLFNPYTNMKAAMRIYRSQGWGAWYGNHVPHIAAAKAAVAAIAGGKGGARRPGGVRGRSALGYEDRIALADLGITRAEGRPGVRDDLRANQNKAKLIGGRIGRVRKRLGKINRALKGRLSKGTRSRLLQERTQLYQELGTLTSEGKGLADSRRELLAGLEPSLEPGDAGDGGDSNQALIDAQNAAAEAARQQTEALKAATAEMKRQNDFATSVTNVSSREAVRALSDVISGQIGSTYSQRSASSGAGALARF